MNNNYRYVIKANYGYGDWSIVEWGLTESEAIRLFNEKTHQNFYTIKECENYEHAIYSVYVGEYERNENWMDS